MLGRVPSSLSAERLFGSFDYSLNSFAVCEIGHGWRLICPPMDEVLVHFVLKGEGVLDSGGERTRFAKDDIIVAPKGMTKFIDGPGKVEHEITTADSCTLLTDGMVAFQAHAQEAELVLACGILSRPLGAAIGPLDHLSRPVVARVEGSDALQASFAAMLTELSRPGPGAWIVAEALMKQCFVLLLRDQMRRFGEHWPLAAPLDDPRLNKAAALMMARPGETHTVASLAREAGMSRSAFAAAFTDRYGDTPLNVLQRLRLRTAARMLRIGVLPVKVVAASVGYASRSHFSKAFKAAYGMDPSTYRVREIADAATIPETTKTSMDSEWKSEAAWREGRFDGT